MGFFDWLKGKGGGEDGEGEENLYEEAMEEARQEDLRAESETIEARFRAERKARGQEKEWEESQRKLWEGYHTEEAKQKEEEEREEKRRVGEEREELRRYERLELAKLEASTAEAVEVGRKKRYEEEKRGWERERMKREAGERTRRRIGATGRTAVKVFGAPPAARRRMAALPRPQPELYLPGGSVRALTAPPGRSSPLAEASVPELGALRKESSLPARRIQRPSPEIARQEGLGSALARLREATKLPLTRVEDAALAEIRANHDRDTLQHISSELSQLGVSRAEAEGAVKGLLRRGLIKRAVESRGEKPIYEVV